MAQTMSPSGEKMIGITDGQINKAVETFRAALLKHRSDLPSEATQQVLGINNLGMAITEQFRKYVQLRVETLRTMFVRRVFVNRDRTSQEMLHAMKWSGFSCPYVDPTLLHAMPRGEGDEVEVVFFRLWYSVKEADLKKEYKILGLKPADPYSLAAVNEVEHNFAYEHDSGTYWKDAQGNRGCITFKGHPADGRKVSVFKRGDAHWDRDHWFAGINK